MTTNQSYVANRFFLWPKHEHNWWVRHSVTVLTLYIIHLFSSLHWFSLLPLFVSLLRSSDSIILLFNLTFYLFFTAIHPPTHFYLAVPIFSGVIHLFKSPQVTVNIFSTHSHLLPTFNFPSTLLFPLYQPLSLTSSPSLSLETRVC